MPSCLSSNKQKSIDVTALGPAFDFRQRQSLPGFFSATVSGTGAGAAFSQEAGGHRWQRVPPTEKHGRRQSSTVTVAVVTTSGQVDAFNTADVDIRFCVASVGAGGQNRQKNATACQATHRPTGITAKCEDQRSQKANLRSAITTLHRRVTAAAVDREAKVTNDSRKLQIGCGQRGDKVRTVQLHLGIVTDHRSGRKMPAAAYLKGDIGKLLAG